MADIRLQKWISQLGIASRRKAETLISEGRVAVNGTICDVLGTKINPETDTISVDGTELPKTLPEKAYYLLCKPCGYITSHHDPEGRDTIFDLPSVTQLKIKLSTVGRLDYETEGLLLLSNDGETVHRLMHPSYKVPRVYLVHCPTKLSQANENAIRKGVLLEDGRTLPAELKYVKTEGSYPYWYEITVHEGRNRLVRRLFESQNTRVSQLIRTKFGAISLPPKMKSGELRSLSQEEVRYLLSITETNKSSK